MSVITESGSFYTFNVKYADEPLLLNVEMKDFIHDGSKVNRPNNALDIYLEELGSESPKLVRLIMESIHKDNKRNIKHIGSKAFGIQYLLRGLYTHNGLLYFPYADQELFQCAFRGGFRDIRKLWIKKSDETYSHSGAGQFSLSVPITTPPWLPETKRSVPSSPLTSSPFRPTRCWWLN